MKVRLADGTGWRQYKGCWRDRDRHGNVRIYTKGPHGMKVRLREEPGTEAFDLEYYRARHGKTAPASRAPTTPHRSILPGSFGWLVQQYMASAEFQQLAGSTRKVRRGTLDAICARPLADGTGTVGALPYAGMLPQSVAKLRDEKARTPEAANSIVKVIRQLYRWACEPEYALASVNPARDVRLLDPINPDGFNVWSEEDVALYEARHPIGTKGRLALDLLLYTGVRRSDVVKLGPQMEREGHLLFVETKGQRRTRKQHRLPILPQLRASIDATPSGQLAYLVTPAGKPYSPEVFGNWFRHRCREAELVDRSAHGLRKLGAQRCAENGATEYQLTALFGWDNARTAAVYVRKANRATLEGVAAPLLQLRPRAGVLAQPPAARTANEKLPPLPAVLSGGSKTAKK
jgi:integrase